MNGIIALYTNNLKNREFDKEVPQNFCPERATIVERQGASKDEDFEVKPTLSKTDSSSCLCIINTPAVAVEIIDAELKALTLLSEWGYPLAQILDRKIVADYQTKTVTIDLFIEAGPLSYFGSTTIQGASRVRKKLFFKCWL